nr:DMT family transporter [Ligilactobacillus acidipiscis]
MEAILLGLIIGFGLPLRTSINSNLGKKVNSSFLASLISFTSGTIFLVIL